MFISFEGCEGSGKTTQAAGLAQYLKDSGCSVILTNEPGGTNLGTALRKVLQDSPSEITPEAELLLYAADRAQHVEEVIRPAQDAGSIVVCDRYCDSTVAYQGYGRGLDLDMIGRVNDWVTRGVLPQLTFLLDIEPGIGLGRIAENKNPLDRLEREKIGFHERVREGYLALAARQPHRFRVIPADRDFSTVSSEILKAVKPLL